SIVHTPGVVDVRPTNTTKRDGIRKLIDLRSRQIGQSMLRLVVTAGDTPNDLEMKYGTDDARAEGRVRHGFFLAVRNRDNASNRHFLGQAAAVLHDTHDVERFLGRVADVVDEHCASLWANNHEKVTAPTP